MKLTRLLAVAAFAVAAFASAPSFAQPAGSIQAQTPLTRETPASILTLTAAGAGTTNSADQSGYNASRVSCVFRQSASGGTPSTTFAIQGKDSVSGQYYTILTSAAITGNSVNPIYVGAGLATTANVSAAVPISRFWRVTATVAGTSPVVTATVGCSIQ